MTNSVGYYHHEREELMAPEIVKKFENIDNYKYKNHKSIDINRDFPFN